MDNQRRAFWTPLFSALDHVTDFAQAFLDRFNQGQQGITDADESRVGR